jgi:hypothetical protein
MNSSQLMIEVLKKRTEIKALRRNKVPISARG